MQKFIKENLKIDQKPNLMLGLLLGFQSYLAAIVMILFYAILTGKFELLYVENNTLLAGAAVIAFLMNAAISLSSRKLGELAGLGADYIPTRLGVFVLCMSGTGLFAAYFVLARLIF